MKMLEFLEKLVNWPPESLDPDIVIELNGIMYAVKDIMFDDKGVYIHVKEWDS